MTAASPVSLMREGTGRVRWNADVLIWHQSIDMSLYIRLRTVLFHRGGEAKMASKAFLRLTVSEAIVIARQIVSSSKSAREIKRRLTEAGFSGKATVINLYSR